MTRVTHVLTRLERKISEPNENGCVLWAGATSQGYGVIRDTDGSLVGAHRIAYRETVGPIAEGLFVDHLCGVKRCVNPQHLRLTTPQQNNEHRVRLMSNNSSGYPNVWWAKRWNKWQAAGHSHGRATHLGYHPSAWDAYCAWRDWAKVNAPFTNPAMLELGPNDAKRSAA